VITTGFSPSAIGWVAIATGVMGLFAAVFIILFYTVGAPFGTLNDISNGLLGILTGILAALLYAQVRAQSLFLGLVTLILALIGVVLVPVGSALVISGRTGWFLAGTYTAAGFGAMGLWLVGLNLSAQQANSWPQSLVIAGIVIGVIMALGLAAVPGMFGGIDAWDSAPWYVSYVGVAASGLGWLILYPIWCIWLGRLLLLK
jgi:hypothetical protein